MTERKPEPARSKRGAEAETRRERRLAEALRANLGRRKAQARSRAADAPEPKEK